MLYGLFTKGIGAQGVGYILPNILLKVLTLTLSFLLATGCSADEKVPEKKSSPSAGTVVPELDVHYKKVDSSTKVVGPKEKVQVQEFFSYACPHCAQLEPGIKKWKATLPGYVNFEPMPASWNETYALLAQAFYTATLMGQEDKLRQPIFNAIHVQKLQLTSPAAIKAFFVQNGVDPKEFDRNFESFAVRQKMKMASNAFRDYKLRSVVGTSFLHGNIDGARG
jgi:hypothetical protein